MSSFHVHQAGVSLEQIASRLRAELRGEGASCTADYFDYSKGLYDGVAACLEAIQSKPPALLGSAAGTPGARFGAFLDGAAEAMRAAASQPDLEDPDALPNVAPAVVSLVGAIEALLEHLERHGQPEH